MPPASSSHSYLFREPDGISTKTTPSLTGPRVRLRTDGLRIVSGKRGGRDVDRESLRAVQEPLKERYRQEPQSACVTLRASGALGEGITCAVRTGRAIAAAGLHPASGGDGSLLCSGDMLLEALAACAGVTMRAVATSLELPPVTRSEEHT